MRTIIVVLLVIIIIWFILSSLWNFIKEKYPYILGIAFLIGAGYINIVMPFVIVLILILFLLVDGMIKDNNERKLKYYLENNCLKRGFISERDYPKLAPDYKDKRFKTSYVEIVEKFVNDTETRYIINDQNRKWLQPYLQYIRDNVMADVYDLCRVSSYELQYTHSTPLPKLIVEGMEPYCKDSDNLGKAEFQKIRLKDEEVKEAIMIKNSGEINLLSYYIYAYKVKDISRMNGNNNTFESEEVFL